jgi:hypothetical protein
MMASGSVGFSETARPAVRDPREEDLTPEQAARNCCMGVTAAFQPLGILIVAEKLHQSSTSGMGLFDQNLHAAGELARHVDAFNQGPASLLEEHGVVLSSIRIWRAALLQQVPLVFAGRFTSKRNDPSRTVRYKTYHLLS